MTLDLREVGQMNKTIQFQTQNDLGHVFAEKLDISRRSGGGFEKIAGEIHPALSRFIAAIRPDPKYQYVLMTPMGSYEYWGMNVNGDVFPEVSLSYDSAKDNPQAVADELERRFLAPFGKSMPLFPMREFGFKTFLDALRYRHHVNKNPEIAYGDIVFAIYNPAMKRVELISRHDREKAKRVGAEDIVRDLDEGRPRQISMGCKVPFDVCTKCGNVSRTSRDYCVHLRHEMGTIQEDGTLVGAVNFFPRFFDLSDVFIPAAKESGVIMKVASQKTANVSVVNALMKSGASPREAVDRAYPNWSEQRKQVFLKSLQGGQKRKVAAIKVSEISKKVLPNAASESIIRRLSRTERPLPHSLLTRHPFGKLLSTLALSGIMLRPREFQYGLLHSMGKPQLANSLRMSNTVFSPSPRATSCGKRISLSSRDFLPSAASDIRSHIPSRSGFSPYLENRIMGAASNPKVVIIKLAQEKETPLLNKIASLYTEYRNSVRTLPSELAKAISEQPDYYYTNFFQETLSDSMSKIASFSRKTTPLVSGSLFIWNVFQEDVSPLSRNWDNLPSDSLSSSLLGSV